MKRMRYFKIGSRVRGTDILSQSTIIGTYRSTRGSFGARVFGHPENTILPDSEYICYKSTLEINIPKPPPGSLSLDNTRIKAGDLVQAYTPLGISTKGLYMNRDHKYAWVKTVDTRETVKVLSSTLVKLNA